MADAARTRDTLQEAFRRLRLNRPLDGAHVDYLLDGGLTPEQESAALAGLLLRSAPGEKEAKAAEALTARRPAVAGIFANDSSSDPWNQAIFCLRGRIPLGLALIDKIVHDIIAGDSADLHAAAFLMTVCVKGMQKDDLRALTQAMASSGETFDYRQEPALKGARLVRRYPTGALSEKTALILPALYSCARSEANVCSPFLVAKSLGHTGGTWDKLSAIPGFKFPAPGSETVDTLMRCGVAMIVTHGGVNPADRKLYQLRSATETIESPPLIVSSIASKHLCLPVHRLLLDVRIGAGAFTATSTDGVELGSTISDILSSAGVATFFSITDTPQPSGSAVGNALEVAEAVAVMGGSSDFWDPRAILEQRLLVIDFFAKTMAAEFSGRSVADWARFAAKAFEDGSLLAGFASMLTAHATPDGVVDNLIKRPFEALAISRDEVEIKAQTSGTLRGIHQFALGGIVNRRLGAGGNDFQGRFDPTAGIVIRKRLGDLVAAGDVLCSVFASGSDYSETEIAGTFEVL